jgi:phosphate:Na+ symporter
MIRKILIPTIVGILAYGFWLSPNLEEIAAGVAIFLFGMLALEQGFRAFTGGVLETVLRRSTNRMWKSLSFGFTAATVMQSSSLVSVITISFLSAGLIGLVQGLGIVFGANVGTTTGAWLIAGFGLKVKISAYAMPMLVFGVFFIFQKTKNLAGFGYILAGLGFLFLGIHHMKEGFETIQNQINLTDYAMEGFAGVLVFTFVGIIATIVMQSSHATLVLVITALATGQVTYENALALTIGANVGTTITAVIGSLSSNVDGRRLALADVLFKVSAGIVFVIFITPVSDLVDWISNLIGVAADDYTLKLAVFHTIFNVAGVIIMVPLIGHLVAFVSKVMPSKEEPTTAYAEPKYLYEASIELPDTAIESVRKETVHLYDNAFEIIAHGLSLHRHDILSDRPIDEVTAESKKAMDIDIDELYNRNIKSLYSEIIKFISRAQVTMTPEQADELFALRAAGRDIVEAIKDTKHMQKNLSHYIASDNAAIQGEYNKIRGQLALTMRELAAVREHGDDPLHILSLNNIKVRMEQDDTTLNGVLERLIREEKITAEMATSLMNDASYAYHVTKNLVQMGEALYATGDLVMKQVEREISLTKEEIAELLEKKKNPAEES